MAEVVAGLAILVPDRLQGQVHRVLTHGPAGVVPACENQWVLASDLLKLAQDSHGLVGEGE